MRPAAGFAVLGLIAGSFVPGCGASTSSRKATDNDAGLDGGETGGSSSNTGGKASTGGASGSGGTASGGASGSGGASSGGAAGPDGSLDASGSGASPGFDASAGGGSGTGGSPGGSGGSGGTDAATGSGGASTSDASVGSDGSTDATSPLCATDGVDCSSGADSRAVCCGGQCVPGDCCTAAECGSAGDAGSDHRCVNVAGNLAGLLWALPCTAPPSGTSCQCDVNKTVSTTLGGAAGLTYDVTLRFRGVVEEKTYTDGCNDGASWQIGGTPSGDTYNIYRLTISSPPQVFYLNRGASYITSVRAIDYAKTVRVNAGATVSLYADSIEGFEIKNAGPDQNPVSISGTTLAQPYDGQFIQMDVVSVVPGPVLSHAGTAGSALSFNGSQVATVAASPSLGTVGDAGSLGPNDVTLEAWFNFSNTSGSYDTILGKPYQAATGDSYSIWYDGSGFHAGVMVTSPAGTASVGGPPAFDEWHHAALTFDSAAQMQTLYMDGLPVACTAHAGAQSYDGHAVMIGGDNDNQTPSGFFYGALDEVRVFSKARTASEIWADMHTHQLGPTAGLVGEWTFDEGSGQSAVDSSGTGNDAVLGSTSSTEANDPSWTTSGVPQ